MPVSPEVRANRPITPVRPTPFFAILATILQPRGRCDVATSVGEALLAPRNHPSAERPLRPLRPTLGRTTHHSQPSFSREAVATPRPSRPRHPVRLATILQPRGRCDASRAASSPSTALATILQPRGRCDRHQTPRRPRHPLATILQPRGRCDPRRWRLRHQSTPRNHPSAERPLRRHGAGDGEEARPRNHPSAERPLRLLFGLRAVILVHLATILQPRGRCDLVGPRLLLKRNSQPSFSREAVATFI